LRGTRRESDSRKRKLLLSSVQSAIFNRVLDLRAADGGLLRVRQGDILEKVESGGQFNSTDADGNAVTPSTLLVDSHRNLVQSIETQGKKRVIALVGVDDLCVIETDDACLILPRERAQDVRAVVDLLKEKGRLDLL